MRTYSSEMTGMPPGRQLPATRSTRRHAATGLEANPGWRLFVQRFSSAALLLGFVLVSCFPGAAAQAQGISFIRDTEIENLMNDYARPIFHAAGLGSQRITVRIVRQSSFNAFVLDGRNVFMNTGTLVKSKTPNQVIGVIAHETGHIAGGHLAGMRAKIKGDATRNLLMKILGIGAMIGGAVAGGGAEDIAGGLGKTILYGSDSVTMFSILSYRRAQESAADQAGISYLNATRQSAYGMLETFEYFAQQEYFSGRFKDPYVRSHPMPQRRIAQLRQLAETSPYYTKKDSNALQLRHDLMRAKLAGFLDKPRSVFNAYPESDQSLPARYARAIAHFFQGGLKASLPKIEALIAERPKNPYFRELKGDFLFRSGRAVEAIAPLKKSLSMVRGSNLIRVRLAQAMLASNQRKYVDPAIKYLRKALVDEKSSLAYRQLANAYFKKGDRSQAYLASAQAYFQEGKLKESQKLAKRAQAQFRRGTPLWIKADDIINYKPPT